MTNRPPRLVQTSVIQCPKCEFDMDEYVWRGRHYFHCCNCEHEIPENRFDAIFPRTTTYKAKRDV